MAYARRARYYTNTNGGERYQTGFREHRAGRKMHPGSMAFDPARHIRGIFMGYCHNCNAKVVTPEHEAKKLIQRYCRDTSKFTTKMLMKYIRRRSV